MVTPLPVLIVPRLLDHKAQQDYFDKVVERYMAFCARHGNDLDTAMACLPTSSSSDATRNPPSAGPSSTNKTGAGAGPSASVELSTFLLALRKLREAVLATASTTPPSFAHKVHAFSVRVSVLAQHPPSYFPSLRYLLGPLHSSLHPLPDSELREFVAYLILDYACRQGDMVSAFELRAHARARYAFRSKPVDRILAALVQGNWVVFWKVRNSVDSYMRAMMNWAADRMRRQALKAVGSSYLNVEAGWVLEGCTGEKDWTWEKLVEVERLGWQKEGNKVIIKRPKRKPEAKPTERAQH